MSAGDWVKFNFPISSATSVLAWGLVQWEDAYASVGLHEQMLDSIKWSLDYFLKCWKPDKNVLYGQVGNTLMKSGENKYRTLVGRLSLKEGEAPVPTQHYKFYIHKF